ncbi:mCG145526, partial [Mus musculus]
LSEEPRLQTLCLAGIFQKKDCLLTWTRSTMSLPPGSLLTEGSLSRALAKTSCQRHT